MHGPITQKQYRMIKAFAAKVGREPESFKAYWQLSDNKPLKFTAAQLA
jgi:hypothetical protein